MATAIDTLRRAAGYIGYTEKGSNITVFWERLKPSFQGGPWCMAFVIDCLVAGGDKTFLEAELPFYCPSQEQRAKERGIWFSEGRPGDVVLFGYREASHTGFLERDLGNGWIQTIEGNTSSGNGGSQTDGGGVYRRVRPKSWVRGYIRPNYSTTQRNARPQQIPITGRIDVPTATLTQQWLNTLDQNKYPDIPVDGDWGQMTTKKFQWFIGAYQDGDHGPKTQAALEKFLRLPLSGAATWTKTSIVVWQQALNQAVKEGKLG